MSHQVVVTDGAGKVKGRATWGRCVASVESALPAVLPGGGGSAFSQEEELFSFSDEKNQFSAVCLAAPSPVPASSSSAALGLAWELAADFDCV